MPARRIIQPSELRRKRKRRLIFRLILWFCLVIVLILGLGFLTHIDAMTVSNIGVEGNSSISADDLTKIAREDMAGNYYFIFSKSNIFLFPKQKIESDILDRYKQVVSLSVKRDGFQSLKFSVAERKPDSLWCRQSGVPLEDYFECYFMDQ